MNIIISGLPTISAQIHHNQQGQQYIRDDGTLWRVTALSEDGIVHIHTVNGWEQLIQDKLALPEFLRTFKLYEPKQ